MGLISSQMTTKAGVFRADKDLCLLNAATCILNCLVIFSTIHTACYEIYYRRNNGNGDKLFISQMQI